MVRFTRPVVELKAAYGRFYNTEKEVLQDWNEGKDFQDIMTGQYCSIRDISYMVREMKTETIGIRYENCGLLVINL